MNFLKLDELALNAAGYLVNKASNKPVNHASFVEQQRQAEYIVKLAEAIKDKNFSVNKVDNLASIKAEVKASIANTTKKYVTDPTKPVSAVNEELIKFAMEFNNYEDVKEVNVKINEFMNQFNSINDVETVGEYFSEGVVKLNALYTTDQILAAVKSNVAKLGNL